MKLNNFFTRGLSPRPYPAGKSRGAGRIFGCVALSLCAALFITLAAAGCDNGSGDTPNPGPTPNTDAKKLSFSSGYLLDKFSETTGSEVINNATVLIGVFQTDVTDQQAWDDMGAFANTATTSYPNDKIVAGAMVAITRSQDPKILSLLKAENGALTNEWTGQGTYKVWFHIDAPGVTASASVPATVAINDTTTSIQNSAFVGFINHSSDDPVQIQPKLLTISGLNRGVQETYGTLPKATKVIAGLFKTEGFSPREAWDDLYDLAESGGAIFEYDDIMAAGFETLTSSTNGSVTSVLLTADSTEAILDGLWTGSGNYYVCVYVPPYTNGNGDPVNGYAVCSSDPVNFEDASISLGEAVFGWDDNETFEVVQNQTTNTFTFENMPVNESNLLMPNSTVRILIGIFQADTNSSDATEDLLALLQDASSYPNDKIVAGADTTFYTGPEGTKTFSGQFLLAKNGGLKGAWTGSGTYMVYMYCVPYVWTNQGGTQQTAGDWAVCSGTDDDTIAPITINSGNTAFNGSEFAWSAGLVPNLFFTTD